MFVNFNILNQLGSPAINSNTFANRPAAGQTGRLFVSTDTYEIYRDNGTTWDLIGGPGSSTITGSGTATQVAYFTSSQAIGSSANLFWDNTSGFLGVATATPTARIEAVKTDGIGIYANFTTNAGSGSSTTALWAKNVTNSSGFAAVIEETTPNTTAGQYPLLIKHSLSSGTAGVGMGTGVHWQLPDDAGTFKTTQLTIETINAAAATYATRYRFNVQNNGSSTPVAYINATGLGIFTATPGAALDIHSTGIIAQLNSTSATANSLLAFQRSGSGLWRIGDNYGGGTNYFELFNTVLGINAIQVFAATNKTSWQATETYTTGQARANYFDYNLSVAAGGSFSSPNAITALGASLDLTLAGNATIPSGARSGLDAYNSISFTGTGTLTHNQGTQIRAYSNVTAGWAFGGSATGTITHLAGLRALFPDNSGSAVNVTNNYALLLNDQTANTGTVTYTNRWGVYQEGASDLNYMAANLLLGSTTNSGERLQVTGTAKVTGAVTVNGSNITINPSTTTTYALFIAQNAGGYTRIGRDTSTGALYGNPYASLLVSNGAYPLIIGTNDTERMRITSVGNVLVGTTTDGAYRLRVNGNSLFGGDSSYNGIIVNNNSTTGGGYVSVQQNGNTRGLIAVSGAWLGNTTSDMAIIAETSNSVTFFTNGSGSERMRITTAGNVLIGTTTDAGYKLQVLGAVYSTSGSLYTGGEFILGGTGSGAQGALYSLGTGTPEMFFDHRGTSNSGTWYWRNGTGAASNRMILGSTGNLQVVGTISTGAPTGGTAASWKLGTRVAATVVLDTTQYIELDVNGTLYKLAIVT